jgi:hypothetical protein
VLRLTRSLLGQRADGGQRFAGLEGARGRGRPHLVHELEVDRLAGREAQAEQQGYLSYDTRTVADGLSSRGGHAASDRHNIDVQPSKRI